MLRQNRLPHSLSLTAYRAGLTNSIPKGTIRRISSSELNQQLDDLQNRLQELQDQYDAKQNELVQIQADLEDAKKRRRAVRGDEAPYPVMYENSSETDTWQCSFSSKSISELISRAEYIQKISDFDRDLMQEYEDTVDQVKEKETQVQEEQAAIVELQQQSSDQQEAIQSCTQQLIRNSVPTPQSWTMQNPARVHW